jgi:dUTP pyrophosphatase
MSFVDTEIDFCGLSKGSHRSFDVMCDFQATASCSNVMNKQYRTILRDREKSQGKDICLFCSRTLKGSGRKNPNCRYFFADDFFEKIDTPEKAYFLGWIASDGCITPSGFCIFIHKKDINILESLRDLICKDIPIKFRKKKECVSLTVCSKKISKDICGHLKIAPKKKSFVLNFPEHITYKWEYIRGYFDGDGSVYKPSPLCRRPRCNIVSSSKACLFGISNFVKIPHSLSEKSIEFSGNNALDFLGKLYDNADIYLSRKKDIYLDWCSWVPSLYGCYGKALLFRWNKTRQDAVAPKKERVSDSGFDLVLLEKIKQYGDVELWDTGIKIMPEFGWYFDLVPRSSIIKSGYMLANSCGVIDRTYVGNILVPLVKIDKSKPDIESGVRLVQIIPRSIVHVDMEEVEDLPDSERGQGGFGSSGK